MRPSCLRHSVPLCAALLLAWTAVPCLAQAPAASAPGAGYRAGTVPATGPDANGSNIGVSPEASAPLTGTGKMGGFGPLTTDNGVASSGTSASAPTPSRMASAPVDRAASTPLPARPHKARKPQRAASGVAAPKR